MGMESEKLRNEVFQLLQPDVARQFIWIGRAEHGSIFPRSVRFIA